MLLSIVTTLLLGVILSEGATLPQLMENLKAEYDTKFETLTATFTKRLADQEKRLAVTENRLSTLLARGTRQQMTESRPEVAFYVQLTNNVDHIGNFHPIVYDLVTTNIARGYNKWNGVFTAPVNGIYVFSWTSANDIRTHMQTELVVNNHVMGRTWSDAYDHADVAVASNTVVVGLNHGDVVFIRSNTVHSGKIRGNQMSTFSGFLLYFTPN